MDYFTKWPECAAIPDQTAETVARALVQEVFRRFGVPFVLHSDQGRNFEAGVFQACMRLMTVEKTRTTPLHPQSDGMVERFNRTLLDYLAKFVSTSQHDWNELLPMALLAYRSAVLESSGYSPARLTFGRELRLPNDLLFGTPAPVPTEVPEFLAKLVNANARRQLLTAAQTNKIRYDLRSHPQEFCPGDEVWLYSPSRRVGRCPKLQCDWIGPATIVRRISDLVYENRPPEKRVTRTVHVNRLAVYRPDPRNDLVLGQEPRV
ncbi:uncharacterized protein LOC124461845 [Drosophila willistoni]|uniref:uncharacterized protein LOC124460875 n=1 Tax=Drosophila willistoni TaxID=7260 RepID=UPI001F074903|nr:uncharacterized protein LOC124460875 [Drosophila willistoni]XP_046869258.1 uncharacterized protein LOC124461845 [Drosophila willistoni]